MRSLDEIRALEQELVDRVRYAEIRSHMHDVHYHGEHIESSDVYDSMLQESDELKARYGERGLESNGQFEVGVLAGKLEALRWVLGEQSP
jgi:hypothetical protein